MAMRPCNRPGCSNLVQKGYCASCAPKHSPRAMIEASRPSAAKRGYDRGWQKRREAYFRVHPFCVDPYGLHAGRLEVATDLDHIVPHQGDAELFRDPDNVQGLCKECHSRKTATEDSSFARATSFRGGHAAADRIKTYVPAPVDGRSPNDWAFHLSGGRVGKRDGEAS